MHLPDLHDCRAVGLEGGQVFAEADRWKVSEGVLAGRQLGVPLMLNGVAWPFYGGDCVQDSPDRERRRNASPRFAPWDDQALPLVVRRLPMRVPSASMRPGTRRDPSSGTPREN